jgi:hypothetical protein
MSPPPRKIATVRPDLVRTSFDAARNNALSLVFFHAFAFYRLQAESPLHIAQYCAQHSSEPISLLF